MLPVRNTPTDRYRSPYDILSLPSYSIIYPSEALIIVVGKTIGLFSYNAKKSPGQTHKNLTGGFISRMYKIGLVVD